MTGIILLAAGASTRMGQPKQQLVYQEQTLLQHAIKAAIGVTLVNVKVLVVLGANHHALLPEVDSQITDIVINPDWEEGMSSSVKSGIMALQTLYPNAGQALLMLCDQPFVTTELLEELIEKGEGKGDVIVACAYQDTIGAPVLFGEGWFNELLALQGQEGAKKILMRYKDTAITIPFAQGAVDIDTWEDYQNLLTR